MDLGELKHAWTAKAEAELAELVKAQAKYAAFRCRPHCWTFNRPTQEAAMASMTKTTRAIKSGKPG